MQQARTQTECAIAVMAKAPRPGQVKTRLVPPLSPEAAMAMSQSFLRDITENLRLAASMAPLSGHVAYAPAGMAGLFDGLLADGTRLVLADGAGEMPPDVRGFGRVLLHAARSLFDLGHSSVCLLNADSPTLPTALLAEAALLLEPPGDRVVFGPADDGGYYLIGMKAPHAHLFADIDWSTGQVADQTRARIAALGLDCVELAPWYDVDDHASLRLLLDDLSAPADAGPLIPFAAPATAACVHRLGLAELLRRQAAE
jgi:rSAM/selenodomain-associated transferase 1